MESVATNAEFSAPLPVTAGREDLCREVLEALPQWFGRPSTNDAYAAASRDQPMLACFADDGVVGMLSLKLHGSATAELHVMGVKPQWHRRGIGRALVMTAIAEARTRGSRLLTVKTLAASHPDPAYAKTRRFYDAIGFLEVEEFPSLWGSDTPCLLMAMPIGTDRSMAGTEDMDAVRAGELRLLDPDARASAPRVAALLADDFVEFGGSGCIFDKEATIVGLQSESRRGDSVARDVQDLDIRPLGADAVLVTYKVFRRRPGLSDVASLRSSVWTRLGTAWRMLFHQGTPLAKTPSTASRTIDVVAAGYDRMAETYLARFGQSTIRDHKLAEAMTSLAPGSTVLDLGCGAGLPVAKTLVENGFRVVGVDGSSVQVELARRHVPEGQFIHADVTTKKFPPQSFDAVTAFYVMNHVPRERQAALLADAASWLKPGGLFIASFGVEEGEWAGDWLGVPMQFSHHAPGTSRLLVEQAGLMVIATEVIQQDNEEVSFLWITARRPYRQDNLDSDGRTPIA